jgi:hypothetical protein
MRSLSTNSSNSDGAPFSECHFGTVAGRVMELNLYPSLLMNDDVYKIILLFIFGNAITFQLFHLRHF